MKNFDERETLTSQPKTSPEDIARAEKVAGPHELVYVGIHRAGDGDNAFVLCRGTPCRCPRRERVLAIAAEFASVRAEAEKQRDAEWTRVVMGFPNDRWTPEYAAEIMAESRKASAESDREHAQATEKAGDVEEGRIYPCADCGTLRTKAEGGTTFTVCDACWDKHHAHEPAPDAERDVCACRRLLCCNEYHAHSEGCVEIRPEPDPNCQPCKLKAADAERDALVKALEGLLLSADASWEEQRAGHDWPEACARARALLARSGAKR